MLIKRNTEQGQAIVIIALAIFALFGLVALALDGGQTFSDRRHAQSAVDAAGFAASLAYHKDVGTAPLYKAFDRLDSNGYKYVAADVVVIPKGLSYTDENNTMTVEATPLNVPDCSGGYGVKYLVTLTTTVHTWFAPVIGITELHNTVSSSSMACKITSETNPLATTKTSVMSCSTDGCNGASDTNIFKDGSSTLKLFGGGLYNNSNDPKCLNIKNGELTIYPFDYPDHPLTVPPAVCANLMSVSPKLGTTIKVITYVEPCTAANSVQYDKEPLECPAGPVESISKECDDLDQYPPVEADDPVLVDGDTASPGRYGDFPPNKVTKLNPGLYCIKKSFGVNQGLTGDGVTFYLEPGVDLSWTGSDPIHLYAATNSDPAITSSTDTNGAYYGLLIFSPDSETKQTLNMAGGPATYLQGTILASSALCAIAGNPDISEPPQCVQFICDTWKNTGNNDLSIKYDLSCLYNPPVVEIVTQEK